MNITFSENQFETHTSDQPMWDLDEMVDRVRHSLHENVDPLMVRQTLIDVLADYENARILPLVSLIIILLPSKRGSNLKA